MKAKLLLMIIFSLATYGCWPLLPSRVSDPPERWLAGQMAWLDQQIISPGEALENNWRRLGLTEQPLTVTP